jgi:prepilin-type processing-associated H-X9-DG protein
LQAALAPYLGNRNVRTDSADHMLADLDTGIVKKIFSCPAQEEPKPSTMIGAYDLGWYFPPIPTSFVYNEALLGFEGTPHRLRGNLNKAHPSSEIVFMTDGVPRPEGAAPFNAWFPTPEGRFTLSDVYTNDKGGGGMTTEFDMLRHPRFRMNIVFCDGHVESLIIGDRSLEHAVLINE